MGTMSQRKTHRSITELLHHLLVHLTLDQEHRGARNRRGPRIKLQTIEIIDSHQGLNRAGTLTHALTHASRTHDQRTQLTLINLTQITQAHQNIQLQLTQLTVRNNDEITATTRRIHKADIRQLTAQITQTSRLIRLIFRVRELIPQLIQEQRVQGLQHILLRGVVLTHLTASLRVTHRLEHRTENSRRNL